MQDPEANLKLFWAAYLICGAPVAWFHMKKHNLIKPATDLDRRMPELPMSPLLIVGFVLATMWPLLLFAIGLTNLLDRKPIRKPVPKSPTEDARLESDRV